MRSWEERIAGAAQALHLTPEEFEKQLAASIGLTKENGVGDLDDDDIFKFGDFREVFKTHPVATLRKAFKSLREGKAADKEQTGSGSDPRLEQLKALGLKVRLEDADTATLLPLYDPTKSINDPITRVLKTRFGEQPVIAFHEDGKVALEESGRYIADIEQGYHSADAIQVDGKLAKLWPIGSKPNTMVDEDPLFPGKPLRNGYSTVNNRNWSDVVPAARQLCRIIVERGEIDVHNKEAVLRLLERADGSGHADTEDPVGIPPALIKAYPEAELEYRERKAKDELPKLKVELGSLAKPNNPFGLPRKY